MTQDEMQAAYLRELHQVNTSGTYTRLRDGSWGVRANGPVKVGETVDVVRKDGRTNPEQVARVVWTDGAVSICSIVRGRDDGAATVRRSSNGARWTEY